MKELRSETEEAHRLKRNDFVSHIWCVAPVFAHGAPELRGVVALGLIDFEMLAEPLAHVGIGTLRRI